MANHVDFSFHRGEDFSQPVVIKNAAGTAVVNITGWTLAFTMREWWDQTGSATLSRTTATGITITDGAAGEATITFTKANTETLTPKTYVYDLSRTDSGQQSVLMVGYVHIKGEV